MRGGPLSDAEVVDALQPFLVTFWAQKDRRAPPAEVKALYDQVGRRLGSNVICFVLDSKGGLLHAFNGFPRGENKPSSSSTRELARHFAAEIAKGAAKTDAPPRKNELKLPDVEDGVRLTIRLKDDRMFESYRAPVVEVVPDQGEWKTLARTARETRIDASTLSRWLRLCYPPGVNEQLKPYDAVSGELTLKPEGARAILRGRVAMKCEGRERFEGALSAVVTYEGGRVSVLGVLEGTYEREDKMHGRTAEMRLVAVIESRPK